MRGKFMARSETKLNRFSVAPRSVVFAVVASLVIGLDAYASERVYMNLGWQESAGVTTALNRAAEIIERDPDAKIEFLVHGKNIKMFADGKKTRRESMIRLGRELAKNEGVTFRVCDHALLYKSLTMDKMPSYFTTVDYVPDRIYALRKEGYEALSFEQLENP